MDAWRRPREMSTGNISSPYHASFPWSLAQRVGLMAWLHIVTIIHASNAWCHATLNDEVRRLQLFQLNSVAFSVFPPASYRFAQ